MKSIICAISHVIGHVRVSLSSSLGRIVLVMAGAYVNFSDVLAQVAIRDKNTNCFVVISQPPNTSDFKIGGVHAWSKSNPCSPDQGYDGLISHGYSFNGVKNDGERMEVAGWRYGYAVNGVLTPPYINAYFGDFRLVQADKSVLAFRLGDQAYSLENLIQGIDQLAQNTPRERFDADFVKKMARIWDSNPQQFYRSMLNLQLDDVKTTGRGAVHPEEVERRAQEANRLAREAEQLRIQREEAATRRQREKEARELRELQDLTNALQQLSNTLKRK